MQSNYSPRRLLALVIFLIVTLLAMLGFIGYGIYQSRQATPADNAGPNAGQTIEETGNADD